MSNLRDIKDDLLKDWLYWIGYNNLDKKDKDML